MLVSSGLGSLLFGFVCLILVMFYYVDVFLKKTILSLFCFRMLLYLDVCGCCGFVGC